MGNTDERLAVVQERLCIGSGDAPAGIRGAAQAEKRVALVLPPCDMKDPSAIPYDAKPYLKLSPTNQFVSVELTYRDGSISEI